MNKSLFRKTLENVRKHRDIKVSETKRRMNYLVSKPRYQTTKRFSENLRVIEMKRTKVLMNKAVYVDLAILHINKMAMHVFWYDYIKPKYGEKPKACNMNTYSFISLIKNGRYCENIAKGVEKRFDTSNDQLEMEMLMTNIFALRSRTYSCLSHHGHNNKEYKLH